MKKSILLTICMTIFLNYSGYSVTYYDENGYMVGSGDRSGNTTYNYDTSGNYSGTTQYNYGEPGYDSSNDQYLGQPNQYLYGTQPTTDDYCNY